MATAPVVLTSEELATREARNVVMISSEEILPRKIAAYTTSKSEISFMFRQPSASAILINKPFIELELQFIVGSPTGANYSIQNVISNHPSCFGRQMEGLPFLSKCVRTTVVSINGATQTYRNSEYMTPYLRTQVSREAMKKIGTPFNDFQTLYSPVLHAYDDRRNGTLGGLTQSDSEQADLFDMAMSAEKSTNYVINNVNGDSATFRMTFREPLFMGVFGGLAGNDSFPLWSCEQNKSPSLLHVQQCTINFNLLDNWEQNLFGLIQNSHDHELEIKNVSIANAHLCCTYVQPPPKYIASALASNVTYATYKMLRFESTINSHNSTQLDSAQVDANAFRNSVTWTLNAVSFPYMPSCFLIEIAPDYNTKCKRVLNAASGTVATRSIIASKEDKRMGIVQLDLIINTSPDVVPSLGGTGDFTNDKLIHLRYNSRQLYEMYLKNCASVERAPYTYKQWFYSGCTVILSPQDMNGILPSQHIRGNVSIQGSVTAVNTLGYSVYIGSGQPGNPQTNAVGNALADNSKWVAHNVPMEKYRMQIIGVYSNCYLALDAKSGLVGENVLSEQFGNSLRLSSV